MTRRELLDSALSKVATRSNREDTFPTIAKLWSAYLFKPISESDVCALMILLKAARLSSGYSSADSLVDIAGYAACAAEYIGGKSMPMASVIDCSFNPLAEAQQAYDVRNGIATAHGERNS